jgi:hypothetical protein
VCCASPDPPRCEGRRPVGLRWAERTGEKGFLLHLADAAWLEAASVDAFRIVRRELRAHGAPRRLLRAASRSKRDEVRHAELAWAIDRWLRPRLSPEQRRRVREARIFALAELAGEVRVELPAAERERLGLPGSEEAAQLVAELDRSLALTAEA